MLIRYNNSLLNYLTEQCTTDNIEHYWQFSRCFFNIHSIDSYGCSIDVYSENKNLLFIISYKKDEDYLAISAIRIDLYEKSKKDLIKFYNFKNAIKSIISNFKC